MKEDLQPGLSFEFKFQVPETKAVPYLYPEAEEFQVMPKVFGTGFMGGLIECACIKCINHFLWTRPASGPWGRTSGSHIRQPLRPV